MKFRGSKEITNLTQLLLVSLLMLPLMIKAQSFSGVTGVVTDSGGAVVPGVQVLLLDTKTSRELTTKTNDQGSYTFTNITPGEGYRLTFTAQGFQAFVLTDVQLGVGKTETHNVQLTAGQVSETVQVTSTAGDATLNTTDPSIGNVIGQRQLRELPIQIRDNPAALMGLQPGVIGDNVGTGATNRVGSVTGARADQGNITVDGIDANDQATQQAFVTIGNIPIDSVQEFRAVSTNPNASEGRSSGGQIQLVTKPGSNEFHGSLREYYRTDKTGANTFFNNRNGIARPKLERHQFGGSFSGPLPFFNFGEGGPTFRSGKDRSFFFFDYEGRRDNSQTSVTRTVPLQHLREGRLAYINNNPGCTAASRIDTAPNCISFLSLANVAALDPKGVGSNPALLSFINGRYPAANDVTGGDGVNTGLFRYNAPVTLSNNTYTGRIDWNISDKQTVFGRATITRNDQTNAVELFPGDGDSEKLLDKSLQVVGGHTWVLTSNFTNQVTIGLSKQVWDFPVPVSAAYPNQFSFVPLTDPFADISFQDRDVVVPTYRDDMTWTFGSHQFQFGGQFKPIRQKSTLINDFNFITVGLGGATAELDETLRPATILDDTSAIGAYDSAFTFLLGRLASLDTRFVYDTEGAAQSLGTGRKRDYVYDEYEFYVQDNWKIRNDLTLNLGLRYHLYPAPYEKNGFQSAANVDFQELLAKRLANAAAGISGESAEPFLSFDLIGKANNGRPLYETDKNNFAPRIGFAYNPSFKDGVLGAIFGDRKTVLRGGAAIVYDRIGGALTFVQDQSSYIFDSSASRTFGALNARTALLSDPRFTGINTLPVQNTAPVVTRPATPYVDHGFPFGMQEGQFNYGIARDFEVPYSYQWSFGIQRELPGNFLLDVSYVGRKGKKLLAQADAAQILNFKDPASGQTMIEAFNALQTQLQANVAAASITPQPWIENQLNSAALANYGVPCSAFGVPNCTRLIRTFFRNLAQRGGTSDLLQQLSFNGLLNPNVGLSSQFAVNAYITNLGFSDYNGMLVSLQKRFSKGFEFDVNYTWSHSLDNNSTVANTVIGGLIYDVRDTRAGRANSDFDIRHLLNINGIWDLPVGRGRAFGNDLPGWADFFIGGWTLSGIMTARSGLPFTSTSGSFPVGFFTESPSVLNGGSSAFAVNIRDEGSGIQYFADPAAVLAALRYPRHGESGNRNIFRGEGFFRIDTALAKRFKMPWSEGHVVTFRAEAYNLTNSNFFGPPDLTFNSTTFGRITTSQSAPRVMQFALRYDF